MFEGNHSNAKWCEVAGHKHKIYFADEDKMGLSCDNIGQVISQFVVIIIMINTCIYQLFMTYNK